VVVKLTASDAEHWAKVLLEVEKAGRGWSGIRDIYKMVGQPEGAR